MKCNDEKSKKIKFKNMFLFEKQIFKLNIISCIKLFKSLNYVILIFFPQKK